MKKLSILLPLLLVSVLSFGAPSSTLSGTGKTAANICAGATDVVLDTFKNVMSAAADDTITQVTFTTAGTYAAGDLTNLKLWTATTNNFATAVQVGGTITTGLGASAHSVTGLSIRCAASSTTFFFVTATVSASAVNAKTINIAAIANANGTPFTFTTLPTFAGTKTAGAAQTISSAGVVSGTQTVCIGGVTTLTVTGPAGTWSSGNTAVATVSSSALTAGVTGVGAGNTTITYTITGTGCLSTATYTVTSNPAITGTQSACVGGATTLSISTGAGTWSTANGSVASVSSSALTAQVTGVAAGNTTISYVVTATGCRSTATYTVNANPGNITGTQSVCVGGITTLTTTGAAGTWSSASNSIATVSSSALTAGVTGVGAGNTTISYTITATGCFATATYTVNPNPGNITGTQSVCIGGITTLTTTGAAGTWSSASNSIATVSSSALTAGVTGVGAGNTTISYTITATGCFATATYTVTSNPAITGTQSACVGGATTLSISTGAGTWSTANGSVASVSSSALTAQVTGVAAGNTTISYVVTATGCRSTATYTVNANPGNITGTLSVCEGGITTLTTTGAAGTWSSASNSIATVNSSALTAGVTGVSAGNTTISYTITATGCFATTTYTVNPNPTAITGTQTVCIGGATTLTTTGAAGTWGTANGAIATVSSSALSAPVTGVAAGNTTISYTITATGCFATATYTVTSNPAITGTQSVCVGGVTTLSISTGAGTWSTANGSIASVNSSLTSAGVTGVAAGNTTISYVVTATGCRSTATYTVNANPGNITGTQSVCAGGITTLTTTGAAGTWSSASTSIATVSSSALTAGVTGVGAGNTTISYTITATGCFATATYTVNPNPTAITGTQTVCIGGATTLTTTGAAGTWSSQNNTIATVGGSALSASVTGVAAGSTLISYTITATGCFDTAIYTVTSNPAITGTQSVCVGGVTTLSISTGAGTWSTANGSIASVNSSLTSAGVTGVAAGNTTISYVVTATGCRSTATYTVNANPGNITGTQSVCAGGITTLTTTGAAGTWSSASTSIATVSSAALTAGVTGVGAGNTTISYTITATGCFATATYTVNANPTAITGTQTVCIGGATTLTTTGAAGTWTTANGAIASVSSSALSAPVTGVAAGNTTISYTITATGCFATATYTVTSNPAITGTQSACVGGATTLSISTGAGTWSTANGSIASVNSSALTAQVTGVAAGNTTISYVVTATGCRSTATYTVNANPGTITGTQSVCIGKITTLTTTGAAGTWSSASNSIATVSSAALTAGVTGVGAGNTTISYTITATGCFATATLTVNANPTPITGTQTVCIGGVTTLTTTGAAGTWATANGAIASVSSSALSAPVTGVAAGNTTISYSITATGCFATATYTVTANPAITGTATACIGGATTLSISTGAGTWSTANGSIASVNSSALTAQVTGVGAGTAAISYVVTGTGCRSTTNYVVTANPAITGTASACVGGATTLTIATGAGTWSTANSSIASVNSTALTAQVKGIAAGNTTISYVVTTSGCLSTVTYSVNATPGAITGNFAACVGTLDTLAVTNSAPTGVWSSNATTRASVASTFNSTANAVINAISANTAITITYAIGTCSATHSFTVNAANAITGTQTVCGGSVTTFTETVNPGTWSSANPSIATVNSSALTAGVTGVALGTTTISYKVTATGCVATRIVSVNQQPGAITGKASACPSATTTLSDSVAGGTWLSGTPANAAITGSGQTITITAGTTGNTTSNITYTIAGAFGGSCASTIRQFSVNPNPAAMGNAVVVVCAGSTISFTEGTAGGTWSSGNTGVATVNATPVSPAVVGAVAAGFTSISYTLTLTGCFVTKAITVNTAPSAITGTLFGCLGASTTLFNSVAGGVWASSAPATASTISSGQTVTITGVTGGGATSTISYTIAGNGGSCAVSKIYTVNSLPAAIAGGSQTICANATTNWTNAASGNWTTASVSIASVNPVTGTSVTITGIAAGNTTITYTNAATTCFVTRTVTVNGLPTVITSSTGTFSNCPGVTTTLSSTPAGGTWNNVSPAIATIGAAGDLHPLTAGITTISYTVNSCSSPLQQITVNALPGAISGTQAVCAGSVTTFSDTSAGGTWSSAATGTATVNALSGLSTAVTGVAAGNTTITFTKGSTGCFTTRTVTVNTQPGSITGTSVACVGTTNTLSCSPAGGAWTSFTGSVATIGSPAGDVHSVSLGTSLISYTIVGTGGSCASTLTFTVSSSPAALTGTQVVCEGAATTFTESVPGGTWSSNNTSVASVNSSSTSPASINGLLAGNTFISYSLGTGCSVSLTVTVNAQPGITGTLSTCPGTTVTLNATPTGGTWNSGTTSVATIGLSAGDAHALTAGTSVISYTKVGTGGSCTATKTFTVQTVPGTMSGTQTVCQGSTVTFSNTVLLGTWTSSNTSVASVDAVSGAVTGVAAGNTTINYSTGCAPNGTRTITVNAMPTVTGSPAVCVGAATTLSNTLGGGSWVSSATGVATVTSSGMVTGVTAGTAIISNTVSSCTGVDTITVNANPAAIAGTQSVCIGSVTSFTDGTAGGNWSIAAPATATISASSSTVNITGVSVGNTTVSYTLPVTGCFAIRAVSVNSTPGSFSGSTSVCEGATVTLSNAVNGGTWSVINGSGTATVASSGAVTGLTAGSVTVVYSIGSCSSSLGFTVLANPAAITGTQTVCAGSVTTFADATVSGTWSAAAPSIAIIDASSPVNITGGSVGNTTITYTGTNSCFVTRSITVNTTPGGITNATGVCLGATVTLGNATPSGTWSLSNTTGTATITSSGAVTGLTAGNVSVTYTLGSCFSALVFTVNPNPSAITGVQSVCEGAITTFADTTAGGTWTSDNSFTAAIDGSSPVNITGVSAGTTTISYSLATGCFATRAITVNANPVNFTGAQAVCQGTTVTLGNSAAGGTWSRSNGSGTATINGSSGAVTGTSIGTVNIKYTVGSCFASEVLSVNTQPASITGPVLICDGSPTSLFDATPGGSWSSNDESLATVDTLTGIVTEQNPGSVTIVYTLANNCFSSYAISVNEAPVAPDPIGGSASVCAGTVITLTETTAGGTWSSSTPSVATVGATGSSVGVSALAAGIDTIYYTVSNACASSSASVNVTVFVVPTASVSASNPCTGYSANIVFTGTSDAVFSYNVDGGSSVVQLLTGGSYLLGSGVITSSHNYTLIEVHTAECSSTINQTVTIGPIAMTWVGGEFGHLTDWNRAANWSCNTIPGGIDDVTIPSGTTYSPVVGTSADVSTRSLNIASGASVALNSGAMLHVNGTFTNNGTVSGAGILTLDTTVAQTVLGKGIVNNFDLNNSAGATLTSGARMTVNSVLSVTAGTLATGDSVILNSTDTTVAARVAALSGGASITGNVIVNQYIPGGYRRYRFWSQPFNSNISLGQVENFIDVTGTGGAANGFTTTASGSPSAFRYDPMTANSSLGSDPGWKAYTNISPSAADSNKLQRYQGIRIFMRGQPGQGLGYITETPLPVVIKQWGVLNQGDQIVTLQKGSGANQDYNMIGNPYASPVDIGTVLTNAKNSGLITGSAFYVWNTFIGASGFYQTIPITTPSPTPYFLQANECFQVRAASNGVMLNFAESNKGSNRNINMLKALPEYVSLHVYDGNYHPWDVLNVKFNDEATASEDDNYDARKLLNPGFSFYSLSSEGQKLAIDARPYDAEKTIPLGISSDYTQEFIIKAEGMYVPNGGSVYLHDKLLNEYVMLNQGTEYRFTITKDQQTQGDNRFELSMKPADVTATATVKGLKVSMTPNPATDEVTVSFNAGTKENASLRILDMSGVSMYSKDLGVQQNGSVNISLSNFAAGVYMIEFTSGNQKSIQRLVKE